MSTIYDVAKLAGVSHTAVSAVINDRPIRMKEDTRVRILDAAKSLGYQANRAAQQLSTGKFNTIAMCFKGTGRYIFVSSTTNQLVAGVVHSASENGLFLLLTPTREGTSFEETIDKLPSQGVGGGIVIGPVPLSNTGVSAINSCSLPLVCIDAHPAFAAASTVDTDHYTGMKLGVEHLIASGHKQMAYIGPAPEYQCLLDRMAGFYRAVQDAELSLAEQKTHIVPPDDVPGVVRQTLDTPNGPTAIICAEGVTGHAVMDEAHRLGLRIPGDLTILAYDDVPGHPLLEQTNIIRNDFFGMGEAAGNLLRKLIDGECTGPVSCRLAPELLMRTN